MLKRVIGLITLVTFSFTNIGLSYAQGVQSAPQTSHTSVQLPTITLPHTLATIEHVCQGDPEQTVVIIKDAHCHFQAQIKQVSILETLFNDYQFDSIYVEGAINDVDTTLFTAYPEEHSKRKVFTHELEKGMITGADYFSIMRQQPTFMHGLEKERLYTENTAVLQNIIAIQSDVETMLAEIKQEISLLKNKYFSRKLYAIDALRMKFNQQKDVCDEQTIIEYISLLFEYIHDYNISLTAYPELETLRTTLQNQTAYDSENPQHLLEDVRMFSEQLMNMLTRNKRERQIQALSDIAMYLEKGITLDLMPEDNLYFKKQKKNLKADVINSIFRAVNSSYVADASLLDKGIRVISKFYALVQKRDRVLYENYMKYAKQNNHKKSVIVAGGYHATKLSEYLTKKNISHMIVSPHISNVGNCKEIYINNAAMRYAAPITLQLANMFDDAPGYKMINQETVVGMFNKIVAELFESSFEGKTKVEWDAFVAMYHKAVQKYLTEQRGLNENDAEYQTVFAYFKQAVEECEIIISNSENSKDAHALTTMPVNDASFAKPTDDSKGAVQALVDINKQINTFPNATHDKFQPTGFMQEMGIVTEDDLTEDNLKALLSCLAKPWRIPGDIESVYQAIKQFQLYASPDVFSQELLDWFLWRGFHVWGRDIVNMWSNDGRTVQAALHILSMFMEKRPDTFVVKKYINIAVRKLYYWGHVIDEHNPDVRAEALRVLQTVIQLNGKKYITPFVFHLIVRKVKSLHAVVSQEALNTLMVCKEYGILHGFNKVNYFIVKSTMQRPVRDALFSIIDYFYDRYVLRRISSLGVIALFASVDAIAFAQQSIYDFIASKFKGELCCFTQFSGLSKRITSYTTNIR